MMMIKQSNYEVLKNPEGELLFGLAQKESVPNNPKVIYDGGQHAILYRAEGEAIMLDYLPPIALDNLGKIKTALFVEFDENKNAVREYDVSIRQVKSLPLGDLKMPNLEDLI
jgi:hypothetical protein